MSIDASRGVENDYTPYPMDCSADNWSAKRKREDSTQDKFGPAGVHDEFEEIGIG